MKDTSGGTTAVQLNFNEMLHNSIKSPYHHSLMTASMSSENDDLISNACEFIKGEWPWPGTPFARHSSFILFVCWFCRSSLFLYITHQAPFDGQHAFLLDWRRTSLRKVSVAPYPPPPHCAPPSTIYRISTSHLKLLCWLRAVELGNALPLLLQTQ